MKAELHEFAVQIAPRCEMAEIGFNVDAIMEHVKSYFNEQRRYEKRGSKVFPSNDTIIVLYILFTKESWAMVKHILA